ncbi:peptidoglycan editing factor PgeF [Thorsellia kenyensis]|uniref:Purine nucleoside phosphorylase n=1 Tax=Thorsellia kenyensis TaxID=1549888 RepID=A0ABV6C8J9_9GAMM
MSYFIYPSWPSCSHVSGLSTTRMGGQSEGAYSSFNLGAHVGDMPEHVKENRRLFYERANLPDSPFYLNQTHSVDVAIISNGQISTQNADAVYTCEPNRVCAVLTADCLPVLFCSKDGLEVAASHAGWRGLSSGILENTIKCFKNSPEDIMAWFGPAIGSTAFEVGKDVYDAFVQYDPSAHCAFSLITESAEQEKYLANIYQLARLRLNALGLYDIFGGEYCTVKQNEKFYSYRKEGQTGRMLSAIWIKSH